MKLSAFTAAVCLALSAFGTTVLAAEPSSHQGQTYWTSSNQSSLHLQGDVKVEGDYKWGIYSNSEESAVTAPDTLTNLEFDISYESNQDNNKKPLDVIKAENGGSVAFGSDTTRTLNNLTITLTQADAIQGRQDIEGLHASGGSIKAYVKGNINITAPSTFGGQTVMVQNSKEKVGTIVLDALGDINIHSQKSSAVVQGAINGANGKTDLTISGKNVSITTDGDSAAAYNVYDQKWGTTERVPGSNNAVIQASKTLTLKSSKLDAVNINRANTTNSATTDKFTLRAPNVHLNGARSAVLVRNTDKSKADLTIAAENASLISSGASAPSSNNKFGTLYAQAYSQVTLTGINGKAGTFHIENTAADGKAIESAGTLTMNQANTSARGNVDLEKGSLILQNQSDLHLVGDKTLVAHNVKLDTTSSITYDTTKDGALDFGSQKSLGEGKLVASSTFIENGKFTTREQAAAATKKVLSQDSKDAGLYTNELAETKVWGKTELKADGTIAHAYDNVVLDSLKNFSAITTVQWRNETERLEQRLGEVRSNSGTAGAWARVYGGNSKADTGTNVKVKTNSIQVGADYAVDNWVYGGAFAYTKGDGDFTNGSGSSDSYQLAAYATGSFDSGLYVDAIARVGLLQTDFDAYYNNQDLGKFSASADNTAYGVSLQTGWKYDVTPTFFVEPQAQLAYSFIKGDSLENAGVHIDQDDIQSLTGRLGALFGAHFQEGKGRVFLHASVNHDFLGDADSTATYQTQIANNSVDLGGTWFTYGFGLQAEPVKNLSVYATLDRANGSDYTDEYRYSLGVRYAF